MECFEVRELSTSYFSPNPQQGNLSGQGEHQKGTCHCSHMSTACGQGSHPLQVSAFLFQLPGLPGNGFPSCGFPVSGRRWGWDG